MSRKTLKLSSIIGKGYDEFWNCRKFYRIVKGSKGSKKSKTTALWYIYHLMKYPSANLLVIRAVFSTLRTSCLADLQWAAERLGVSDLWHTTLVPLEMTNKNTGQKILFRGLDKAVKLGSIAVAKGYLCWVWFEEFHEIDNEEEFEKLQLSIRGEIPPETGLWMQITGTFNPWSEHSWLKKRFFDNPDSDTWTDTTTYRCNEFFSDLDRRRYDQMYVTNPRMARIVCDGDWGIAHGLVYENWEKKSFDIHKVWEEHPNLKFCYGLDFGYSISYNAFVAYAVDTGTRELWIFDELYEHGMPNIELAKAIIKKGYGKEKIWADCAEPKSIDELRMGIIEEMILDDGTRDYIKWTLPNVRPAMKGADSLMNGVQRLQSFKMYVHPLCPNVIMELSNYCFDQDPQGNFLDKPIKEFDHCLVAGTMVRTEHGEKPIEEIRNGEKVWTHMGLREVLSAGITQLNQPIWCVEFENGTKLEGTWNHPVFTSKGVKDLKDLKREDVLFAWNGSSIVETHIKTVYRTHRVENVYDLTVNITHNFFANGILVHNCMDALRYGLANIFVRARGHVYEAKGVDNPRGIPTGEKPKLPEGRVRRVYST